MNPVVYTHWKAAQKSTKNQLVRLRLHLRQCLVRLGVEPAKLTKIIENREVFWDLLGLLPRDTPIEWKSGYENWVEFSYFLKSCVMPHFSNSWLKRCMRLFMPRHLWYDVIALFRFLRSCKGFLINWYVTFGIQDLFLYVYLESMCFSEACTLNVNDYGSNILLRWTPGDLKPSVRGIDLQFRVEESLRTTNAVGK